MRVWLINTSEANEEADKASMGATINLFNWARNNDGGLWLKEGSEDDTTVRKKNSHPWVRADSDTDDTSDSRDS